MVHREIADAELPSLTPPGAPADQRSPSGSTLEGRTLAGGLRVLDQLGSTPDGTLYQAEYPGGIEAALLILRPGPDGAELSRRRRFEQAVQIQHHNVAAVYEVGEIEDGSVYVVLEQLAGEPLSSFLAADPVFALPDALDVALQAAAGLKAAHRVGFVHGNLSPNTIMLTQVGDGRLQVKLIGFTVQEQGAEPLVPGDVSVKYASPERLAGQPPDARSDVFSLGSVLHHLLTGKPPERGQVDSSVPEPARAVLSTALAPVPGRRFRMISEFEAMLEQLAGGAGDRKKTRVFRSLVLGAVGVSVLFATAGVWLLSSPRWRAASEEAPVPVASPRDPVNVETDPSHTSGARPEPVKPSSIAPRAARQNAPRQGGNRLADSARSAAVASGDPAPRTAPLRSVGTAVGEAETDRPVETGMVTPTPPEEAPPTLETRAEVYLRIGLDEASRQLGRRVHAIEGMSPLFLGLARSRFPAPTDTTRPVVRAVYIAPNGRLILLDQQRIRPGQKMPAATATSWRIGDVMLHLHGEAQPMALNSFARRVR
jgi:serine/threonine protein kinase